MNNAYEMKSYGWSFSRRNISSFLARSLLELNQHSKQSQFRLANMYRMNSFFFVWFGLCLCGIWCCANIFVWNSYSCAMRAAHFAHCKTCHWMLQFYFFPSLSCGLIYSMRSLNCHFEVLDSANLMPTNTEQKPRFPFRPKMKMHHIQNGSSSSSTKFKMIFFQSEVETANAHIALLMKEFCCCHWNNEQAEKHQIITTQTIVFNRLLCASIHLKAKI